MDPETMALIRRAKVAVDAAAAGLVDSRPSRRRGNIADREPNKACTKCKSAKAKCSGQPGVPCSRCVNAGVPCEFPLRSKPGRKVTSSKGMKILEAQQDLEEVLSRLQEGPSISSNTTTTSTTANSPSASDDKEDDEEDEEHTTSNYLAADSLQVDVGTGDFVFMGPMSVPKRTTSVSHLLNRRRWLPFSTLSDTNPNDLGLSKETHDQLVDLYFNSLNGFCAFIDETSFRLGMASAPDLSPGYSTFLHLCILAIASHLSDKPEVFFPGVEATDAKGWPFLQRAIDTLEGELGRPRPTTVSGIALMCACLADLGETSMSWIYCGIAVRLAQDLGLQVDARPLVDRGAISGEMCQMREDAFWTIYVQDKLLAVYAGRTPGLTENDHGLKPPTLRDGSSLTLPLVSLCDTFTHIIHLLYSLKEKGQNVQASLPVIEKELQEWSSKFSPQSTDLSSISSPQTLTLVCLCDTAVILLNRPLLRRRCLEGAEGLKSFTAAVHITHLAQDFDTRFTIRNCPTTMCQNLYVAASFLLLLVADLYDQEQHRTEREIASTSVDNLILLLTTLSTTWGCASQALSALEKMRVEYTGASIQQGAHVRLNLDAGMPWWQDDSSWTIMGNVGWPAVEEGASGLEEDPFGLYGSFGW